ncbi:AbrB family transcriptional regulator [Sulfodiicoccus acidiphilus]|uniref:AbrB family transcriptional regulator n=1 Tax=Sulfodiicoccus acidiphilus TaxID=1670455 RepID=A0A348B593_9CREN|nr:AbrB/MazE/SpoVT family DNA-binding domain-containing protein [Sulfodiicoccus acidiphilus]BBD73345.1 AbrB family transcriptional regulator [Sulfodiicoccus acidiphilus]GGT88947.1 AbrB family transcriptional regulator [Sulfodiicoccus acidiphilus]
MDRVIRVGKRNSIYLPKDVAESINVKEGDKLVLVSKGDRLELIPLRRPSKYWTEIDVDEVEEVGEEVSRSLGIDR